MFERAARNARARQHGIPFVLSVGIAGATSTSTVPAARLYLVEEGWILRWVIRTR